MAGLDYYIVKGAKSLKLPVKPWLYLVKGRRIVANLGAYRRRRAGGVALLEGSRWRGFIPLVTGYASFDSDSLPGVDRVVLACRQVFEEKAGVIVEESARKRFFTNILTPEDLRRHRDLLDFAVSRPVVEIIADYLHMVPKLRAIGLYYSPANATTKSSQKFHFDGDDIRQVKCFINVHDVDEGTGPFTFLPADKSRQVRLGLKHPWGYGKFADDQVFSRCATTDVIKLVGPAGTGAMVDTTNCMHFGSRARQGFRLVFMFQYTTFPDVKLKHDQYDQPGMPIIRLPTERYRENALAMAVLNGNDQ